MARDDKIPWWLNIKGPGTRREKPSLSSGRAWLFLTIVLFLIDYIGGPRYTGFKWVWDADNYLNTLRIVISSAVFTTIVLVYYVTKIAKNEAGLERADTFFLIFAFILSFFLLNLFWFANIKAMSHFFFILLFGLVFIKKCDGPASAYLFTSILLILDFFGYGLLLKNILIFQYIPLLTFIVIIYVYAKTEDTSAIVCLISLIIILFILGWNDPAMKNVRNSFSFVAEDYEGVTLSDFFSKIITGTKTYTKNMQRGWQSRMEYATGGYYKGNVEEKAAAPLGVFIEKLMTSSKKYFPDEPVIIWADLRAKTLKDPIGIIMKCKTGEGKPGTVKPDYFTEENRPDEPEKWKFNFEITTLEQESLECKFPSLPSGTHNVKLSAEFNFETMAYLKTYFMDIERMRALRRDEIDPLNQYGITDTNPVAVFTNGPVKIGIGTNPSLPIGLGTDYIQNPRFGITIENQWNGKIQNITDLIVLIPTSMELEETNGEVCNGWFEKMDEEKKKQRLDPNSEDDNLVFYDAYNITEAGKETFEFPIDTFESLRCIIKINENNIQAVLGTTPVAVHYYRAYVKYIYDVEKSISVNVVRRPGEQTNTEQTSSISDQNKPTGLSIIVDNNGDGKADTETDDIDVILRLTGSGDGCRYKNRDNPWSSWSSVVILQEWRLSQGSGTKTIYYQCKSRDDSNNVILSDNVSTTIELKAVI